MFEIRGANVLVLYRFPQRDGETIETVALAVTLPRLVVTNVQSVITDFQPALI